MLPLWLDAVRRNLANIVSILGVLPICLLFGEEGYQYLLPLIVYNNVMDDLDGILARKLSLRSHLGALLDNICDGVVHTAFIMIVGMRFAQQSTNPYLSGLCLASSLLAVTAVTLRGAIRIDPATENGGGSPTNELIRHLFFVLLLAPIFSCDPTAYLIAIFIIHSVSMHVPFKMPIMIRSLTKSATAICGVNLALLVALLSPTAALSIAATFMVAYTITFLSGAWGWLRKKSRDEM